MSSRIRSSKGSKQRAAARARIRAYEPPYTGAEIRHLRGLGHALDPVLAIGKEGVTSGVVTACKAQLLAHELIKVRVGAEAPEDRHETAKALAEQSESTLVQVLGRVVLLYRHHPKDPKIPLPRRKSAGTKDTEE